MRVYECWNRKLKRWRREKVEMEKWKASEIG